MGPDGPVNFESEEVAQEREREREERLHYDDIRRARHRITIHLADMKGASLRAQREVRALAGNDLYDIEIAETGEQVILANAFAQIDLAVAAIEGVLARTAT